ncbi:hypothetical protein I4F81_000168 [Pyropia yezoensis]|uniref:Uncharacterized protein n=1 Tax=Pyropia yezoensis TaxID=2788 RepID=A0ACC3BI17_PYRYE|nr:hypothetical protein I4F81_000168 [Neopyropia yezoensis]
MDGQRRRPQRTDHGDGEIGSANGASPYAPHYVRAQAGSSSNDLRIYFALTLLLVALAITGWAHSDTDATCAARLAAASALVASAAANGTAATAAVAQLDRRSTPDKDAAVAAAVAEVTESASGKRAAAVASAMGAAAEARLPPCAAGGSVRAKSFLILFMGHSGSTALLSEMTQHSSIMGSPTGPEPIDHFEFERNTSLAVSFTRQFLAEGIAAGKVPGFKLRPTHIMNDPEAFRAIIKDFGVRLIWNTRGNLLKQAVGEYRYRYLKDLSVIEGLRDGQTLEERCPDGSCAFNVSNVRFFHDVLRDLANNDRLVEEAVATLGLDGCVLPVPYEEYLYGRETTMARVYRFLGLPVEDHPPNRQKATHDSMCMSVGNMDVLCDAFYACPDLRWMFDDWRTGCKCSVLPVSHFRPMGGYCDLSKPLAADVRQVGEVAPAE